eukprot:CAMPEP_0184302122 /NCGR_PEP_ID=MMETSP1049-20130417/12178_1 /TAXON_ID=77928 /ORGANISM="Proteomonas sulcata, Strain CCMP704" /LENGTH=38 /DNA_ID= /DNA_START= /DNA_END= /DNA_ORIENTATION=
MVGPPPPVAADKPLHRQGVNDAFSFVEVCQKPRAKSKT